MFKIIGSMAVIVASGLLGISKYSELCERRRMLCAVRDGAERIRDNLRCMCMPLYECFLTGGEFFEKAALKMTAGDSPESAIKNTAVQYCCFKKKDVDCIYRFSEGLGCEDCDGQIRNVEMLISGTEKNIEEAVSEINTKGKLFVKGSFLIAAAVVLVLI